jgi:hypothetical protein
VVTGGKKKGKKAKSASSSSSSSAAVSGNTTVNPPTKTRVRKRSALKKKKKGPAKKKRRYASSKAEQFEEEDEETENENEDEDEDEESSEDEESENSDTISNEIALQRIREDTIELRFTKAQNKKTRRLSESYARIAAAKIGTFTTIPWANLDPIAKGQREVIKPVSGEISSKHIEQPMGMVLLLHLIIS